MNFAFSQWLNGKNASANIIEVKQQLAVFQYLYG